MLLYLCPLSALSFLSVQRFLSSGGQARDVDPMLGLCWPIVYDADQTLAQY